MHLMWAKLPNHVVLNTEPSSWPLSAAPKFQVKLRKWVASPHCRFPNPPHVLCPSPPHIDICAPSIRLGLPHPLSTSTLVLVMPPNPPNPPNPQGRKACEGCTRRHRSCDLKSPCQNCTVWDIPCVAQLRKESLSHSSCALPPHALTIFTYSPA
jgi:hypothetical protein